MNIRFLFFLVTAVVGSAVYAVPFGDPMESEEGVMMTLEDCIEVGLQNNFSVRIMRNLEQQAVNNATRGHAGQLPSVGLSAVYGGSLQNSTLNNNVQAGADVSWTLFDGFSIRANYNRLQELRILGTLDMQGALEDFVASASSEYYHLIRQQVRLGNLRKSVILSRERLRIVQESYRLGASSGLDYQQAQVDYNADTSEYLAQVELVRKSIIQLNQLLAFDNVDQITTPADTIIIPNRHLDRAQLEHRALESNTHLLKASTRRTISDLELKRLQGRNYPSVRLNAGYGYRQEWGPTIGASMGFSLYDGGNRKREQANARLNIENTRLQQEQLEQAVQAELAGLWLAYTNNLNLWEIEKNNLQVARSNYEVAMERYRLSELSGIALREAQLSLLKSEERLSTVEYSIKICEISLLLLSGTILTAVL
ncbi:MAG: TolC family protein [Bacteroidales bacterium]|nr:TolC family protein [Bacteroidales bacterium]